MGNNPAAMSPLSTSLLSGTYLNTDHPVNCATENTITSWHYCYFTSGVTPGQTYTMTVGVWSLDTNTNVYRLTEGSARTITLVPVATLAKVFCVEETLEASNSVSVAQNDVIGVVLPNNNAIPVLTSNAALSLIRHSQAVTTPSLVASEFSTTSNRGLHLYSNLGMLTFLCIVLEGLILYIATYCNARLAPSNGRLTIIIYKQTCKQNFCW